MGQSETKEHSLILWYKQPAAKWEEALPVGNGRLGAMVFGGIGKERFQLNEDTLWSGFPRDTNNYEALRYLKRSRELIADKNYAEAEKLVQDKMLGTNVEAYQPMADLYIEQHFGTASARDAVQLGGDGKASDEGSSGSIENYVRQLDIDAGLASVSFNAGGTRYIRETFVSAVDQVLAIRYLAEGEHTLELTLSMKAEVRFVLSSDDSRTLQLFGRCPSHVADNYLGDHPHAVRYESDRGITYETMIRAELDGGSASVDGESRLHIRGARCVLLLLSAATSFQGYDVQPAVPAEELNVRNEAILKAAFARGYEELRERHTADHRSLFRRVSLELGQSPNGQLPTDKRLEAYKRGERDPQLEALYFQFGRYLLMASSRPGTQPANLQGIWNDRVQPPWNSDYTTNINTQMNYWPAETGNLSECHEPLLRMIGELSANGSRTAAIHYDCRGWTAHHNVDLWRTSTPTAGHPSWAFWPMGGVWLTQHLWEHYLYNPDEAFLRGQAYPLMKGAALFCLDWLHEDTEGSLITSPSTSPENKFIAEDGSVSSTAAASAMDMTLIRELFLQCIEAAELLQTDGGFATELKTALGKLAPLQISKDGMLQEWLEPFGEHEPGHRHVSHLYGLYPGTSINRQHTPELVEAARRSLESRIKSGGGHTGWSCAWLINLYARLLDAEASYGFIRTLLARSTHPNLFDDHPPFQIDGNFGGAAGISELLLQSHSGGIELLPALPAAWPDGFAKGLKARGGFIVDLHWKTGKLTEACIRSTHGSLCSLRSHEKLIVRAEDGRTVDASRPFRTTAGAWYTVTTFHDEERTEQ
ncbi:glycoside hydrolase family 95 protein [Paenibacillus sp. N4]|uniref:glycoside hydrolase family 95 protein n=1 Tax=Paenibacillus vietnamensis TaxID=2590547 RepID=UPI001CD190DD|nr:glycoside hydrolase family 95 protein [Paenibacillus vietnamensis]MCA0753642.1 glycoside hydrolase family 95 protein [Paenibacillus vietnamensis]